MYVCSFFDEEEENDADCPSTFFFFRDRSLEILTRDDIRRKKGFPPDRNEPEQGEPVLLWCTSRSSQNVESSLPQWAQVSGHLLLSFEEKRILQSETSFYIRMCIP